MSEDRRRLRTELERRERRWETAIGILNNLVAAEVCGVVFMDPEGRLFVVPRPDVAATLFRMLQDADWETMARLAEEYYV